MSDCRIIYKILETSIFRVDQKSVNISYDDKRTSYMKNKMFIYSENIPIKILFFENRIVHNVLSFFDTAATWNGNFQ